MESTILYPEITATSSSTDDQPIDVSPYAVIKVKAKKTGTGLLPLRHQLKR